MSIRRRTSIALAILFTAALIGAAWYRLHTPVVARGDIVATVDGAAITKRDVEARLVQLLPPVSFHGNLPPDRLLALRRAALDQLILDELIVRDALARGATINEAALDTEVGNVRARFDREEEYRQALTDSGFTEPEFRAMLRREMIVQRVIAERASSGADADQTWREGLLARAHVEIRDPVLRTAMPLEIHRQAPPPPGGMPPGAPPHVMPPGH